MTKINDMRLSKLGNAIHCQYLQSLYEVARDDEAVYPQVSSLVDALGRAVEAEREAIHFPRSSALTPDIMAADLERGRLYQVYKTTVSINRRLTGTPMAPAADKLWDHLKHFAIRPRAQRNEESGKLTVFIESLREKYSAEVEQLGMTTVIDLLHEANDRMKSLSSQRIDEYRSLQVGRTKAARKASDKAWRSLADMVESLALVQGTDAFEPFIRYVNEYTHHIRQECLK